METYGEDPKGEKHKADSILFVECTGDDTGRIV
jgi:hypothetical protein